MNTKQLSCAERIADEFATTEQLIAKELEASADPDADEYQEGVEIYSVKRLETIRLQLSGGGPADFVEIVASDGEIVRVEYLFQDWFDSARLEVREDSPVYEWVCQQYEYLREVGE